MSRIFSGVQPSGSLHLGNYIGAFRQWVDDQQKDVGFFCVVDLHALTVESPPEQLRARTLETAAGLLAAGLDPGLCTIFLQSHVAEHAQLSWLLECTASYGELQRMTQFKEKTRGRAAVRAGLFTYPALMAADILLYDTDRVPVGDDQRQHIELTRDVAMRFNAAYGETFVVPEIELPRVGARVMDLQHPDKKMSKSVGSPGGTISIDDPPEEVDKKIRRAVTDAETEVRFDRERKPGVSNLLELLCAATGESPEAAAARYDTYGALKADVAAAVVELLRPVRARYLELTRETGALLEILEHGADHAQEIAAVTLARAQRAIGLVARARPTGSRSSR
ncbi:MAG: tryptophan--tRNA ligase [Acidimicrobiales bacterium]|jgi:tryptophanyl-tRNA synthetase